jgi:hypothetical protein
MSYATMPTFEGNALGVRNLGTLKGGGVSLSGLGDTTGDLDAAVAAGIIAQNDADTLSLLGVTDDQVIALLNGQTDYSSLMYQLATKSATAALPQPQPVSLFTGLSQPTSPGSTANTAPARPAVPGQPLTPGVGQSPPGSTLLYSVTWIPGLGSLSQSNSSVIAQLTSLLPSNHMSVISGVPAGGGILGYGIQLKIFDSIGHQFLSDVTSVLNGLLYPLVGSNLTGSSTVLIAGPGQTSSLGPSGASNLTTWFEANWGWLAAALGAIVIVPVVIKKL